MIHQYIEGATKRQGLNWKWDKNEIIFCLKVYRFMAYFRRRRKHGFFGENPRLTIFDICWIPREVQ